MKDYITSLVQQTLHDYFKKADNKQHILVLFTNHRAQINGFWEHMKQLTEQFHVSVVCSEKEREDVAKLNVHDVYVKEDLTKDDVQHFSQTFPLLYCPSISYGFLAKLSLLLDDAVPIWLTMDMLLNGKEVLLGNDVIIGERKKFFWYKPSTDNKVKHYMKELQKDGVQFSSMSQATKIITKQIKKASEKRPLLLAKHVQAVAELGEKELVVPNNCIITPMAKDMAKSLQMKIKMENNEKRDER